MNQGQWQKIRLTLQKIWGYDDFRSPQGEIIQSLLTAKDCLVVMPTGGGKSICFQLPALLQNGLTLVISPLIALMENQVQELQQLHLQAALLHSELPRRQRLQTLQAISQQQLRLLYLSPETLFTPPVWQCLSESQVVINGLILDEAHCLVQWGETFRPAYRRLGVVRSALLASKPPGSKMAIAAFTATADPTTQAIITNTLNLQNPDIFLVNPYRANLNLEVKTVWTRKCRRDQMLRFINSHGQQSGLIYVRSRRESEVLGEWLQSLGYRVLSYHAGLSGNKRRQIEADWLDGSLQFVVCTSAFGMGINKADVGWVVHFHTPQLLLEYVQEVGRSGRNGNKADCLALVSEPTGWLDPEDRQLSGFFVNQLQRKYQKSEQLAKQIPVAGEIGPVVEEFRDGEMVLAVLHSLGELQWLDPFRYQRLGENLSSSVVPLLRLQKQLQGQMRGYVNTKLCRWGFLLAAFGYHEEARGFSCGHCDNWWRCVTLSLTHPTVVVESCGYFFLLRLSRSWRRRSRHSMVVR